jgi:signal transduction histidine kinase
VTAASKRLLRLIGPYPFNPRLIFIFLTSLYFSRYMPLILTKPVGMARVPAYLIIFIAAAFPSAAYALGAMLFEKYRIWKSDSIPIFLLEVVTLQAIFFALLPISKNFLVRMLPSGQELILPLTPILFISSLFFAILSFAVSHGSERRISERLMRADELALKLELDAERLVLSDEAVRKQTSQFLHDKVQSELMVVAMELKGAKGLPQDEVDHLISRAIDRLESTRAVDIRNLVQILTPNFEDGKLTSSIELLKRQYGTNLKIETIIDPKVDLLSENQQLGIFRIIEQCLLNSFVHGPATEVKISLSENSSGNYFLTVEDDGPGVVVDQIKAGVGSAIIDSWLKILNGRKVITSSLGNGFQFEANFTL